MTAEPKGGDLLIVDNSVSGWTGLRYLEEWTQVARAFDIATGYFEIGSLLALDGNWQNLEKIRVLMGDETTQRTKRALLEAVKNRAEQELDRSLDDAKDDNPFLEGAPAVIEALKSGQIECKVYNKHKFHAKGYITHAKLDVVGSRALVGSSNFTLPGLTENIELNIQVQSGQEVAQLQQWFEDHWKDAVDVTEDIVALVSRHTKAYTPFEVYAKALHEFFRGHEITASEWEESRSHMFSKLDRYQKEAYWALMKIARQHGGAFLCDGVGLGKTFVGLMLIERLVMHEGKRVVLFAPKGAKEGVWEPHLRSYLAHIGGIEGTADFSNLAVFSHTDLSRGGDFPERFRRISELADAVIIDEAHHFRNPGRIADTADGKKKSRYYDLYDILDQSERPKALFMLTATPINNRLTDFRHMAELFTRKDDAHFARTLGVNNLTAHFNKMEKALRQQLGQDGADLGENISTVQDVLGRDQVFQNLVVQRSRAYARESQEREGGQSAVFPERRAPQVAEYSIRQTYGRLLDVIEQAFEKSNPLFILSVYYPLYYYGGDDDSVDPFEENRQKAVVGLIRTLFLKRFESSVRAFELSCERLMQKLLAFVEVHSELEPEKKRLNLWKRQNAEILQWAVDRQLGLWGEEPEDEEDDIVPPELLEDVEKLSRDDYAVDQMIQDTYSDLNELVKFLDEARKFKPAHDDKLKKLIRLLTSKDMEGQKVIVFTEFADTARYLYQQLQEAGIEGLEELDSGSKTNRAEIVRRFSPYYNGTTSGELADRGVDEIKVLISTDVLSEGLNLQDACRLINYDIHWNPVRLMQRIGRVDRRLNPEIETLMTTDHPELVPCRGKVTYWNFLPPDELNQILTLYTRVTHKTLVISETLGIEGGKLFRPDDAYGPLKEFNQAYEGTKTALEEMHLEYQGLLQDNPELADMLADLPNTIFSGRERASKGARGVFFCYGLPALDKELGEFTNEAGTTRWYLYDADSGKVLEEPSDIIESVRSTMSTPRKCDMDRTMLVDIRSKVLRHIKNTYLKRLDVPLDAPKPSLKCWMELGGE